MAIKKIAIIGLFILLAGAAINIVLNIKDTLVNKSEEIVVKDKSYTNIHILSDNATIEIVPTNNNETKVEFSGKMKKKSRYNFHADVKGDTLNVELKEKRWSFQLEFTSPNIKLTVYIPEKEYKKLMTKIDNGRIIANNLSVKDVHLTTDNGSIEMQNIKSDNIRAKSDNGQIIMKYVDGKIKAETDNGRIILVTNNLDRSIDLKTDNGLIEIQSEKEPSNATINASVDLGKIDIFGTSNKQTIYGNGDHLIKLETDNGKITVKKIK
ncbi:hypothetical protein PB01_09560 [Psychrobacillus glaciei]|uniref:DUF4097 domain-containing protein n=1 Tax=Psychrobacillus glaciei TaxID=2283160 RepID=A0A5J6SNM8_9BACI|nr:DUF4097 family beta strand repeat-containing protein [Psychrobacillus glaciei]QFF99053.1 hypothetical protein PB01_09560 [Psychrobacillus glaciei]